MLAPLALATLGCVERVWDVERLEVAHPRLVAVGSHRLGEATPYLLPAFGALTLFLCRWPDGAAVPVSLPPGANAEERRWLEAALRAWEGAGLGVRFGPREVEGPGIEIRFGEDVPEGEPTPRAAQTGADCAIDPAAVASRSLAPALPARLVYAEVHLLRFGRNAIGQDVPYAPEELAGSLLHELGHALGFQGHALHDDTIMSHSVDVARRAGRRILAGKAFRDDTLRALYSLPSGVVVRRVPLRNDQTDPFDRLAALALRRGLQGPWVRVGNRAARIAWHSPAGASYRLFVFGLRETLRNPTTLELTPVGPASRLLLRQGPPLPARRPTQACRAGRRASPADNRRGKPEACRAGRRASPADNPLD